MRLKIRRATPRDSRPSAGELSTDVERDHRRAQATYRPSGMKRTHYLVYEELKPGVRFFRPA